jgi:glycosyltransferase involved in cell wall biosynthesis
VRQRFPSSSDGICVFIAVCKFTERENPLSVLQGFQIARGRFARARLILVGAGPLQSTVVNYVREHSLSTDVYMPGYVPYRELPSFYAAADVFVHAPAREPWGLSVGEALASGLPVVASTTVGSAADVVVPGKTGELANPNDPEDLASALTRAGSRSWSVAELQRAAMRVDVTQSCAEVESLLSRLHCGRSVINAVSFGKQLALNRCGMWDLCG